jgi:hypothetical protein
MVFDERKKCRSIKHLIFRLVLAPVCFEAMLSVCGKLCLPESAMNDAQPYVYDFLCLRLIAHVPSDALYAHFTPRKNVLRKKPVG